MKPRANLCPAWRRSRGVATVEFALVIIPLLVLTLGVVQVGRAFYHYNTVVKSARDATRFLSMRARGQGEAVARCLAVFGSTTCGAAGTELAPGLTTARVHIEYTLGVPVGAGLGSVDLVTVRIEGAAFRTYLPFAPADYAFGDIRSTMRQAAS
ncbi:MAG: pilus assembly protein [Burkholderiales bacterium]|nr:pilus assembly protein [Burkholderiales bacterium]